MRDIDNLSIYAGRPVEVMRAFCVRLREARPRRKTLGVGAHYIFTEADNGSGHLYGQQFAAYIRENDLGTLVESEFAPNRLNTRRQVKAWIWTPAPRKLDTWYRAHRH